MFRLTFILALISASSAVSAPIKVYIIAGQSNATGASAQSMLEPDLWPAQENLYQFAIHTATANPTTPYYHESDDWEQLRILDPEYPGTNYGSELSFGQAMKRRLGEKVAIIKTAANGTSLAGHWLPIRNNLYPWMIDKVQSSLDQLQTAGYEPNVSGFIWIQHEGDANTIQNANNYDTNLLALASSVRTDLDAPNLPFLINQAHINLNRDYLSELRQSQANAVASDPLMQMFSTDDLALNPDNVHFTGTTHIEVGRRFADLLLPSADYNNDGAVNGADLVAWRGSIGTNRIGDGNADGASDGADFLLWQRQLGAAAPASVASIPEPGGLASFLLGAALLNLPRARRLRVRGGA